MTLALPVPGMPDSERISPPPLVLVANDQEWSARSLESIFSPQGYAVVRAHTGRQALDLARRTQPDVVIIDAGMPDVGGIEVCRLITEDVLFSRSTPIVVTTAGPASRSERLAAYKAGAWEYVSQPLDSEALLLKLQNFIASKRQLDRCRDDSLLDSSTGLYNVRGLARRAQEVGAEASRRRAPLACVAVSPASSDDELDVDPAILFERLTEHLSDVFRRTARISDIIGHLGKTEFAIIAPATGATGALRLIERIRETMQDSATDASGQLPAFDVRAGYCAVTDFGESSVDAVELLLRAATALRHAKSGGGVTRVSAFEDVPTRFVH